MGKSLLFSHIFLLCLFQFSSVWAESLKVAFAEWPPWKIYKADDVDGIDARIIRELGRQSGKEVEFIRCPWPRCITLFEEGKADLISSFGKNGKREGFTHYLGKPYYTDKVSLWVRKESDIEVKGYADLQPLRIGVTRGSVYFPRFDSDQTIQKIEVGLEEQMFQMLDSGRIDIFIGYQSTINYLLSKLHYKNSFKTVEFSLNGSEYHLGLSKKSPHLHLTEELTDDLSQMIEEGEVYRIIDALINEVATDQP